MNSFCKSAACSVLLGAGIGLVAARAALADTPAANAPAPTQPANVTSAVPKVNKTTVVHKKPDKQMPGATPAKAPPPNP